MTILRTPPEDGPEIWCRCDGGPHGFLSIAAHAHADALSVEVRYDGVDLLADPGTYCYHGEPAWRSYFRSTSAHNTVEIDGENQSVEGGPFLWNAHASSRVTRNEADDSVVQTWSAHHSGYARLDPSLRHVRTVTLDRGERALSIVDVVVGDARHTLKLIYHLGPEVAVDLSGAVAALTWPGEGGSVGARLELPDRLRWSAHRGETDPVLGWYSPRFGVRVPTTTLVGSAELDGVLTMRTTLVFPSAGGGSHG
jgi:hypothetical protein